MQIFILSITCVIRIMTFPAPLSGHSFLDLPLVIASRFFFNASQKGKEFRLVPLEVTVEIMMDVVSDTLGFPEAVHIQLTYDT